LKFRKFFVRGLAFVLPTILTIALLAWGWGFVKEKIAAPINAGVRQLVVQLSDYPQLSDQEIEAQAKQMDPEELERWSSSDDFQAIVALEARRAVLLERWSEYAFPLDLIGLLLAIVLIYIVGAAVGSYLGRWMYRKGESVINKIPLIKQVYPSIKQITDFFLDDEKIQFSRVVAVEYPRKGLWSLGLVTGSPMKLVQQRAQAPCLTVFVPSSPTPFTGYVIIVPQEDTIDLSISIEEALRYTVSGGVVIPAIQRMESDSEAPASKPD
jgi:uncharacterized membrane protein